MRLFIGANHLIERALASDEVLAVIVAALLSAVGWASLQIFTKRAKIAWAEARWAQGGGGRGIRTPDRSFGTYNGLANRRLQPLGHPSGISPAPARLAGAVR